MYRVTFYQKEVILHPVALVYLVVEMFLTFFWVAFNCNHNLCMLWFFLGNCKRFTFYLLFLASINKHAQVMARDNFFFFLVNF